MHDVGPAQPLPQPEVAVTDDVRGEIPEPAPGQKVARCPDVHRVERDIAQRVRVAARQEVADVEPVREQLPGAQLPRRRLVPANDDDSRLLASHDSRSLRLRWAAIAVR